LDPQSNAHPTTTTTTTTTTGSGKTFTAIMMTLQLLRQEHDDQILVYSVPTKQVRAPGLL